MAPRIPETFEEFERRARALLEAGASEVRFGHHHHSHALCLEEGRYCLRRLETTREEAEAYMREHGIFMPEHNELIAKPRTLEWSEDSLEGSLERLRAFFGS